MNEKKELTRKLGFWAAMSIAVGATVGSGIFITIRDVAEAAGSPSTNIYAWLFGGLLIIPQMMVLSEMATAYPDNGGGYIYMVKAGFRPVAFLYGWACFLALDTPTISIVALTLVDYLSIFFPILKGFNGKIAAVIAILICTVFHYRSVKSGGAMVTFITIAKIVPFLFLIGLAAAYFDVANLGIMQPNEVHTGKGSLISGISATSFAYLGFIAICYMAGEFKNPGKTIPKALISSVVFVTLLYTLVAVSVMVFIPFNDLLLSTKPITDALHHVPHFANIAVPIVAVAAIIIVFGTLNACIMYQPRMQYAMARDKIFFKAFGEVHPKFETPHKSILFMSVYACILIFISNLNTLIGYVTLILLITNLLIICSIFFVRRREDYKPIYRTPAWIFMTIISIAILLYMIYGTFIWAPLPGLIAALIVVVTGLPAYYFWDRKRKQTEVEVLKQS